MDPVTKVTTHDVTEDERNKKSGTKQKDDDDDIRPITFFCQDENEDEYDHFFDGMEFDPETSTWRHSQATLIQKCNVTRDRLIEARFDNCDDISHSKR